MNLKLEALAEISTVNDKIDLYMDEIVAICDKLETMNNVSEESISSFLKTVLIKIGDLSVGLVKLNKTNLMTIFKGFKRSELRNYIDKFHVSSKMIEKLSYTDVMDEKVANPTGMKVPYMTSVNWLAESYSNSYDKLSATMDRDMQGVQKDVASSISNETFVKKLSNKELVGFYKAELGKMDGVKKDLSKCFDDKDNQNVETDGKLFKIQYGSMKEFSDVTKDLLSRGNQMINLRKLPDQLEKVNKYIEAIIKNIQSAEYQPSKDFVTDLAYIVRTMAVIYDMAGTTVKTQMVLEHNHILVYNALDKYIVK